MSIEDMVSSNAITVWSQDERGRMVVTLNGSAEVKSGFAGLIRRKFNGVRIKPGVWEMDSFE